MVLLPAAMKREGHITTKRYKYFLINFIKRYLSSHCLLGRNSGFTLVELIVVVSIIAGLLFFMVPGLHKFDFLSPEQQSVATLLKILETLKKTSVSQDRDYVLHLSLSNAEVWITDDLMDDNASETAREKSMDLSDDVTIMDVQFQGFNPGKKGVYEIRFSKHGYCDMAMIYLKEGVDDFTIVLEPFISEIRVVKGRISYDDCI